MIKQKIIINGNNFSDLESFYEEIDQILTKNLEWETGHYIQSQRYGLFYMNTVAIPSVLDFFMFKNLHENRWYEAEASKLGGEHFASYESSFDLANYSRINPSLSLWH